MTPERFATLAGAYGSQIHRWPGPEQAAARAYLISQPEARQLLTEQTDLDAALSTWAVPPATANLAAGIAHAILERQALWRRAWIWLSGAGAAAALAGGLATGMNLVAVSAPPQGQETDGLYGLHVLGMPIGPARPPNESGAL